MNCGVGGRGVGAASLGWVGWEGGNREAGWGILSDTQVFQGFRGYGGEHSQGGREGIGKQGGESCPIRWSSRVAGDGRMWVLPSY